MKLPTEDRPVRMDPDLAARIEVVLKNYSGKDLEKAQAAIRQVHQSGISGSFSTLVRTYESAIKDAVAS